MAEMVKWWNGGMAEWWNSGVAEWRSGRMAKWRNGGWRNDGMADGRMAEWQKGYIANLPDIFTVHAKDNDNNTDTNTF